MRLSPKSLFGRLILSHLIIIFISLLVIGFIFGYLVQNYYFGLKEWKATNNGRRIAKLVSQQISNDDLQSINLKNSKKKINTISKSSNMEIGIMNTKGKIILKSTNIKSFRLNLEKREVNDVIKGNSVTRKIMGPNNKYLLIIFPLLKNIESDSIVMGPPTSSKEKIIGGIVIQTPLDSVATTINNILQLIIYSGLIAAAGAVVLSNFFARRLTRPITMIKESAVKITEGNFKKVKLPENSSEEIKHMVKTFNYAIDQIEETLHKKKRLEKIRKEFVANVSHEFRAPLTSIKGFLEIMQEQNLDRSEIKEYTQIMYKDTEYLEHLLSDLLVLSHLDSKIESLNRDYISPGVLVDRALRSLQPQIDKKNIEVEKSYDDNLPELYVDENRIYQVLINLLENGITYSPEGGKINIAIKLMGKGNNRKIKFSISDQGPGIPEDELSNIWRRFYKVDIAHTRKEKKGNGLGLAIVKDIIEKHRGKVDVKSNPDQKTTFSFILYQNSLQ